MLITNSLTLFGDEVKQCGSSSTLQYCELKKNDIAKMELFFSEWQMNVNVDKREEI